MRRTDERHGATERRARRTRDACGAFSDGDDARGPSTAIGRASVGASRDREGRAARAIRSRVGSKSRVTRAEIPRRRAPGAPDEDVARAPRRRRDARDASRGAPFDRRRARAMARTLDTSRGRASTRARARKP